MTWEWRWPGCFHTPALNPGSCLLSLATLWSAVVASSTFDPSTSTQATVASVPRAIKFALTKALSLRLNLCFHVEVSNGRGHLSGFRSLMDLKGRAIASDFSGNPRKDKGKLICTKTSSGFFWKFLKCCQKTDDFSSLPLLFVWLLLIFQTIFLLVFESIINHKTEVPKVGSRVPIRDTARKNISYTIKYNRKKLIPKVKSRQRCSVVWLCWTDFVPFILVSYFEEITRRNLWKSQSFQLKQKN